MLKKSLTRKEVKRLQSVTEQEWLTGTDFERLSKYLCLVDGEGYARKFHLFGCACARSGGSQAFRHKSTRLLVRVIDAIADLVYFPEDWLKEVAEKAADHLDSDYVSIALVMCAPFVEEAYVLISTVEDADRGGVLTDALRLTILRELFGNPFRQVILDMGILWHNDGAVYRLARHIYDEYNFDQMPRLAELIEQAGCHEQNIIDHCRSGEGHYRGCWVVDLILGKTKHPLQHYNR